jgi:Cu+-exporting ATPase
MIATKTQPSSSTVQDPVCGMAIDPVQAFATRTFGGEILYFCSQRCVGQFDHEHTGSATTGVSDTGRLLRVELPVTDGDGRHGAARLQEQLETMPGVAQVTANSKTNLLRVTYDPSKIALEAIVDCVREVGYTAGTATTQLDIQGMHCASCLVTIEEALHQTRGVLSAAVKSVCRKTKSSR